MTAEDIIRLAVENRWRIEYDEDGQIVCFTGVIDESRRQDPGVLAAAEELDPVEGADDYVHDPLEEDY